ncbi:MAG: hypothetical protein ACYC27_15130 [Armatimonadota bacterium]
MELLTKPIKMKLSTAAEDYFARNSNAMTVGFITKEGREFWFRRDPNTGNVVKITRQEAEKL